MHHSTVVVFVRPRSEDGDGVQLTIQGANNVDMVPIAEKDMPGRRNALRIVFDCWLCQKPSVLQIQQHKGTTYFEWVGISDEPVSFETI